MFKSHRLFPYLLFSFLVVSSVFSLSLSNLSRKRVILKQKAAEEQNQLLNQAEVVSQWVPIDLVSFNQEIEKETAELTEELNQLPSQRLSAKEKTKRQDILQRSLQIKQITKEEHNLMDKDKDGKIDYQEFNLKTAELYSRTYPLMHTTIEGKPKGVFDQKNQKVDQTYLDKLNQIKPFSNNRFIIVVEGGLYDPANPEQSPIKDGLRQYILDIQAEGKYLPEIFSCNNCAKEEIRNVLKTPGVAGTVLIGYLPSAWFELRLFPDIRIREVFPIDLYYMDIDHDWGPEKICTGPAENPYPEQTPCFSFDIEEGNLFSPDIFFGRITSPLKESEIFLINFYFRKNHNYRTGRVYLPKRSLNYFDDTSVYSSFQSQISSYYQVYDSITDAETTSAQDYLSRMDDNYEHLFLHADGNFLGHSFYVPSLGRNTVVTSLDIATARPHFFFFNLFSCSSSLYTSQGYIAGIYTFLNDYGLATIGSSKFIAWSRADIQVLGGFSAFYNSLKSGDSFGVAFKNWFNRFANFLAKVGGYTLIGDPTLVPPPCQLPATPVRLNGPQVQSLINYGDPVLQVKDDSGVETCFPHYVVYSVWPPDPNATAYFRSSNFLTNNPTFSTNRDAVPWTVTPVLPAGQYQWRANLKNSAGQALTKDQVLKVNFSVCAQPSVPQLDMLVYGGKSYQGEPVVLYPQENLTLRIKDVSDRNTSCFPHDVIFNIWPKDALMYVKSSGWLSRIDEPNGTKEWTFRGPDLADLPYGEYELRANLDNKSIDKQGNPRTAASRAPQPLIINFTLAGRPTPTPTPTPTPAPVDTCSPAGGSCFADCPRGWSTDPLRICVNPLFRCCFRNPTPTPIPTNTPTPTPRQICCCWYDCGQDCEWTTSCSGRGRVTCDISYCQ